MADVISKLTRESLFTGRPSVTHQTDSLVQQGQYGMNKASPAEEGWLQVWNAPDTQATTAAVQEMRKSNGRRAIGDSSSCYLSRGWMSLFENRRHDIGGDSEDLPVKILRSPGLLAAISGQFGPTDTAKAPPNPMKMPPMTAIMKHFMAGSFALAAPISTACNGRVI